jgi:hypothetical protein
MAPSAENFFVVTVVSNPVRYKRRYELFHRFKDMCNNAGVNLMVVEQAFGDRPFEVTKRGDPWNLQLRSVDELWVKENLINLGVAQGCRNLPEAKYVAWIDADCRPARPYGDWFRETYHQLQHYQFVQMWEHIQDLDSDFNPLGPVAPSFMANYVKYGTPYPKGVGTNIKTYPYHQDGPISWGSPGLAWAANIEAFNQIGGLPDQAILGAGDWYLAHMLIHTLELPGMKDYSPGYRESWLKIQERCDRWIKKDVGYVSGLVFHDYHGRKVNRKYNTRERILIENKYDPSTDIKYDVYGQLMLETWEPRQIRLRDQIRAYFRARNEDDISVA